MSKDVLDRWLKWNARGIGKDRSAKNDNGGRYYFRGPILYSHDWPVARLIKHGKDGNLICLTKNGIKPTNTKDMVGSPRLTTTINVTCIGAYSKFPADVLSDADMHERTRWLCLLEAQDLIDQAQEMTATELVVKPKYAATGGSRMLDRMKKIVQVYETYKTTFGLKWPAFPTRYDSSLLAVIQKRREEYNDPEAVAKRERAAARKAAKKAFSLNEEE